MQLDLAGEANIGEAIEKPLHTDPHLLTTQPLPKTSVLAE